MIAQHTITHAIQYLREAGLSRINPALAHMSDQTALSLMDPAKPCAAYGLARRTLKRCGSLAAAIKDLEKLLEQS